MEDEKKELQGSLPEEQPGQEPVKPKEGETEPKVEPSTIPYYRFKEKVDQYNSMKEELERAKAESKQFEGMDINELREVQKLQKDLGNPELLADMRNYVSDWYAKKKTPVSTPNPEIEGLKRRMEQYEVDKLSVKIENNLDKLTQEFGDYDKEKLLTLVEEDGYNPTNIKHLRACFKEYFSENIKAKQKSNLEEKIKTLPEGGGSGGKPADTTPDDIGELFRLKKAGKI